MARTWTDIFNNSLRMFGHRTLAQFDSTTLEGRELLAYRATALNYLLERYKWNFAEKFIALSPVQKERLDVNDAEDVQGFDNVFNKPADWVSTAMVSDDSDREYDGLRPEEYRDAGGCIFADAEILYLWYISNKLTPPQFSQTFADALSAYMALGIMYQISPNNTRYQLIEEKFVRLLHQAKAHDGRQNPPQRYPEGRLSRARRGYTRNRFYVD